MENFWVCFEIVLIEMDVQDDLKNHLKSICGGGDVTIPNALG